MVVLNQINKSKTRVELYGRFFWTTLRLCRLYAGEMAMSLDLEVVTLSNSRYRQDQLKVFVKFLPVLNFLMIPIFLFVLVRCMTKTMFVS